MSLANFYSMVVDNKIVCLVTGFFINNTMLLYGMFINLFVYVYPQPLSILEHLNPYSLFYRIQIQTSYNSIFNDNNQNYLQFSLLSMISFLLLSIQNKNFWLKRKKKIQKFSKIEVKNLKFSFQNKKIFENLNFSMRESFTLIGENGSGKTTLLNIINKILPLQEGNVYVND